MGPLQENHSHNGPKKRRRLLLVFPIQQTRPVGHTPQSPRSAPSDGITLQDLPHRAPKYTPSHGLAREGKRRRLPPAAAGGINSNPFFDRLRRPKNSSQPESAGFAGAGLAASPKFGMGHPPDRQPDSLVRCPPERRRNLGAHPKFQNSALPTVRGWGSTSRMLAMPVRYMTIRSNPRPKPACLQEPNRRRSRYHQ